MQTVEFSLSKRLVMLLSFVLLASLINVSADSQTLNVAIHSLKVLNDHDGPVRGSGEIFITIQRNDNDVYRIPNTGHYSMDDDDEKILEWTNTLTIEYGDILKIEVREEDDEGDDSLGYVQFTIPVSSFSPSKMSTLDPSDAELVISIDVPGFTNFPSNPTSKMEDVSGFTDSSLNPSTNMGGVSGASQSTDNTDNLNMDISKMLKAGILWFLGIAAATIIGYEVKKYWKKFTED